MTRQGGARREGVRPGGSDTYVRTDMRRPSLRIRRFLAPLLARRLLAAAVAVLRHALDGDHPFALLRLEDAHALGIAGGDAHVVDGAADQLAAVGAERDLG